MAGDEQTLGQELLAAIEGKAPNTFGYKNDNQPGENRPRLRDAVRILLGENKDRAVASWHERHQRERLSWGGTEVCSWIYSDWSFLAEASVSTEIPSAASWCSWFLAFLEATECGDGTCLWFGQRSGGHYPHAGRYEWLLALARDDQAGLKQAESWAQAAKYGLRMKWTYHAGLLLKQRLHDLYMASLDLDIQDLPVAYPIRIVETEGGKAVVHARTINSNTTPILAGTWDNVTKERRFLPPDGGFRARRGDYSWAEIDGIDSAFIRYGSDVYGDNVLPLPPGLLVSDITVGLHLVPWFDEADAPASDKKPSEPQPRPVINSGTRIVLPRDPGRSAPSSSTSLVIPYDGLPLDLKVRVSFPNNRPAGGIIPLIGVSVGPIDNQKKWKQGFAWTIGRQGRGHHRLEASGEQKGGIQVPWGATAIYRLLWDGMKATLLSEAGGLLVKLPTKTALGPGAIVIGLALPKTWVLRDEQLDSEQPRAYIPPFGHVIEIVSGLDEGNGPRPKPQEDKHVRIMASALKSLGFTMTAMRVGGGSAQKYPTGTLFPEAPFPEPATDGLWVAAYGQTRGIKDGKGLLVGETFSIELVRRANAAGVFGIIIDLPVSDGDPLWKEIFTDLAMAWNGARDQGGMPIVAYYALVMPKQPLPKPDPKPEPGPPKPDPSPTPDSSEVIRLRTEIDRLNKLVSDLGTENGLLRTGVGLDAKTIVRRLIALAD